MNDDLIDDHLDYRDKDIEFDEIKVKVKEYKHEIPKEEEIPKFLTYGCDISLYIKNFIENLEKIRLENYENKILGSLKFQSYLDDLINHSRSCYNLIIPLYDIVYAAINSVALICNSKEWERIIQNFQIQETRHVRTENEHNTTDTQGKVENNETIIKLNISNLVKYIKDFINGKEESLKEELLNYNFQNYFHNVLIDLKRMYSSIVNCSCHLFSMLEYKFPTEEYSSFFNLLQRKLPVKPNNQNPNNFNHQNERKNVFNAIAYLKFIILKGSFENFLAKFFDGYGIASIQDERMEGLLMPGVFYEYILFNDLETKNNVCFHSKEHVDVPPLSDFRIIDLEGNDVEVKFAVQDNNLQLILNDKIINFYTDFDVVYSCQAYNDRYRLYCQSKIEGENKIIRYHEKTIGNASKGFWIQFGSFKYYFKELYCNTRLYIKNMEYVLGKTKNVLDHGQTIQRDRFNIIPQEIQSPKSQAPIPHMSTNDNMDNNHLFDPANKKTISIENTEYYHINQYVELSGYFLLYSLCLMPKVEAFNSKIYGRPMIKVDELESKYILVRSRNSPSTSRRINFDLLIEDMYSIFISSIHIQGLRLIHRIFLLDDFHEENVAISLKTTQFDQNKIQYINGVQIIDLWPTMAQLDDNYLFKPVDKSCDGTCSFDDLIISELIKINNIYPISCTKRNVLSDFYGNQMDTERRAMNTKLKFDDNTKRTIYGEWIFDFPTLNYQGPSLFYVITYFAMIDLFDKVYDSNVEKFSKYEKKYCLNIALDLLADSYGKSTQALPKISGFDSESIKLLYKEIPENLLNDTNTVMWNEYIYHVSVIIPNIIYNLSSNINSDVKFSKNAKIIIINIRENEENLQILECKAKDIYKDIHESYNYIGLTIDKKYEGENIKKYLDEFQCDQVLSEAMNTNEFSPKLYIIDSPVMFDIAMAKMKMKNYKLLPNYKRIYFHQ